MGMQHFHVLEEWYPYNEYKQKRKAEWKKSKEAQQAKVSQWQKGQKLGEHQCKKTSKTIEERKENKSLQSESEGHVAGANGARRLRGLGGPTSRNRHGCVTSVVTPQ